MQLFWIKQLQASVEHDPVSGSRSKRILQFRTGSDWISKKNSTGSDIDIQTALITAVKEGDRCGEDDKCLHVALSLRYSWNPNKTCHYESNHCYLCWMCSTRTGYAFFKVRQRPCCRGWPTTQHSATEHRGAHHKQDYRYRAASIQEQGIRHRPTGDPLHSCRQASDTQLLTSWVSPVQEARPFHVCSRAVGMVTDWPVSRGIEWWYVDVAGYKIINIYKPPRSRLTPAAIPRFPQPSLYVGDFNSKFQRSGEAH